MPRVPTEKPHEYHWAIKTENACFLALSGILGGCRECSEVREIMTHSRFIDDGETVRNFDVCLPCQGRPIHGGSPFMVPVAKLLVLKDTWKRDTGTGDLVQTQELGLRETQGYVRSQPKKKR